MRNADSMVGLLPLGIPLVVMGMTALMSVLSGWRRLANRFAATDDPPRGLRLTSAKIGGIGYNNCLYVAYSEDGIHLRTMVFVRLLHPPLFIPWTAIRRHTRRSGLLSRDVLELEGDAMPRLEMRALIPEPYLRRLSA